MKSPEEILAAAFQALLDRDAPTFAALLTPESGEELRRHIAVDFDRPQKAPTEEQLAQAPFPPEMARFMIAQIRTMQESSRQQVIDTFGVTTLAELQSLPLPHLVAGVWRRMTDQHLAGLSCVSLGTIYENDHAYVLFRLKPGRPADEDPPRMALFRRIGERWHMALNVLHPHLMPGSGSITISSFPGDRPPAAAG